MADSWVLSGIAACVWASGCAGSGVLTHASSGAPPGLTAAVGAAPIAPFAQQAPGLQPAPQPAPGSQPTPGAQPARQPAATGCTTDVECQPGICENGRCTGVEEEPKPRRHFIGIHVARDFGPAGLRATDVCVETVQSREGYSCYYKSSGERYEVSSGTTRHPYPHGEPAPGGNVDGGELMAPTRLLLSYDFAITPEMTLGSRLGAAFGESPPDTSWSPVHAEVRFAYWFLGLAGSFRPYAHVGGGSAQMYGKAELRVAECSAYADMMSFNDCVTGDPASRDDLLARRDTEPDPEEVAPDLEAYGKVGSTS